MRAPLRQAINDARMTDGREEIRQDSLADDIVEREAWLRSFGMTPYTSPGDFDMSKIKKKSAEFLEEKKINGTLSVDKLPSCEKIPGKVTASFKQHLNALKQPTRDCLTSPEWRGARNQVRQALEQNSIEKMVVLGPGSIFACTTEYTFWQYEMAFILAIFELVKQQDQSTKTRTPVLYFQDPKFCIADYLLLSELGGQIVDHPEAFVRHIDERTLVFANLHLVGKPLPFSEEPSHKELNIVTVQQSLPAATENALYLQSKYNEFDPNFDIRGVADRFIAERQSAELHETMLHLFTSIPDSENNLFGLMSIFWLPSVEDSGTLRQTKQVESLGKKAKKWLESL
ncbi:uncharacterized protein M437DRAFT_64406 [Aureobasidium melanogenum CBS 110374]|uniref:SRR1-like domain-containing protein n=1 Tax=Aureobasidium melanogenum (strain CBS 110374) TaxID=1043003 RepID=A0A074WQS7_AURM1|nr:uncharacterized protein M437DRAFT_64406 [Aureobasidium melanogenum CBS 110374]KEQ64781.1 hypothetical protein M437DRAFT_64406 [Aureobasidium melanogenum CBS 110374]